MLSDALGAHAPVVDTSQIIQRTSRCIERMQENDGPVERRVILPPSIYGSPEWYREAFQEAMTLVLLENPTFS